MGRVMIFLGGRNAPRRFHVPTSTSEGLARAGRAIAARLGRDKPWAKAAVATHALLQSRIDLLEAPNDELVAWLDGWLSLNYPEKDQ